MTATAWRGGSSALALVLSDDKDYFKLTLSAAAEVVIHTTTGDQTSLETVIDPLVILLQSNGTTEISRNTGSSLWPGPWPQALVRRQLPANTYYIKISRDVSSRYSGFYNLHITTVTDLGNTTATATPLGFGEARGGNIDSSSDVDHFRLEVTETTDLSVTGRGGKRHRRVAECRRQRGHDICGIRLLILRRRPGRGHLLHQDHGIRHHHRRLRTFSRLTDPSYHRFLALCGGLARPATISDPLYGCQWHLDNTGQLKGSVSGEGINVEEVWAAGTLGAGINVAVVDNGMHYDTRGLDRQRRGRRGTTITSTTRPTSMIPL